jgi:hypothetical protein
MSNIKNEKLDGYFTSMVVFFVGTGVLAFVTTLFSLDSLIAFMLLGKISFFRHIVLPSLFAATTAISSLFAIYFIINYLFEKNKN